MYTVNKCIKNIVKSRVLSVIGCVLNIILLREQEVLFLQFALNVNGERINIKDAEKGKDYYCPCCNSMLVQKKGKIMVWHYAHKSLVDCVGYYDNKGEWHRKMQELFPEKNREIFHKFSNRKHIYDIFTDNKRIIEFQHSHISVDDFISRTKDYSFVSIYNQAKMPIWVFDYTERDFLITPKRYENKPRRRKFYWKRASNIFGDYMNYKNDAPYELWFYINPFENGAYIDTVYDFDRYEKNHKGHGFVKVLGTYNNCKCVIGDIYTEKQFYNYITNQ